MVVVAGFAGSLVNFRGELIKSFVEKGLEVHVAAPGITSDADVRDTLSEMGCVLHDIHLHRTGMNPIKDLATFFSLLRLMWIVRPCFFLAYTIKPVIYGLFCARLFCVPYRYALITGLGYAFANNENANHCFLKFIVKKLYRYSLSFAQIVFFQNPDDQALFRNSGLISADASSCVVDGSGVDISKFSIAPLPQNHSFLMIARLLGDKGVREYAKAAKIVKLSHPDVTFRLVGWIDENPDAISKEELDSWVEAGTIEYIGKLVDVRPAIEQCTVYVLPSYREGTPRTVLEAMAMGRPVITTDAPGCRETVSDGVNGYLVPVKSVDEVVRAMCSFIEISGLAEKMGERSRIIAEEKYDVHKVNAVILDKMGVG